MGARGLTLPPRRKKCGIVFDAKPTDVSDTLTWCDENMSADDMLKLIEGLQNLVRKAKAEDEENSGIPNPDHVRAGKIGGALQSGSRFAEDEYLKRFPHAGRLK